MITVSGVDWKTTRALAQDLREVPENGRFVFGLRGHSNLEQLKRFSAAGVPCPEFTEDISQALRWMQEGAAVFGRREEHTKGRDIVIGRQANVGVYFSDAKTRRRWYSRDYWTKVVSDVLQEWRIHIFDGKSIARGLKVNESDNSEGLIRNRGYGYRMRHGVAPPRGLRKLAKDAVAALGYSYGAVDLLVCAERRYVLEVNSAPAMDNYTRGKYVQAIRAKFA